MLDKQKLYKSLLDSFINYQYRLDHPWPEIGETRYVMIAKYQNDPVFRSKIESLANGVMAIIDKHI